MNQILTFQLASISLNAEVPENNGISGNGPISEAFEDHGLLRFSLSNLPAQARVNLSVILAEKQSLINKAIPGFTMRTCLSILRKKRHIASSWRNYFRLPVPANG